MATTYNRRINLYIKGTQVTNNMASIRAGMKKTINTQARITIGSRQYLAEASNPKGEGYSESKNLCLKMEKVQQVINTKFDSI